MKLPDRIKTELTVSAGGSQASRNDSFALEYRRLPKGGSCSVLRAKRKLHGTLVSAIARMPISLSDGARVFMNGYQTWTYCPERPKTGRVRGLNGLPQRVVDKFGLDRYGDYHFVEYPFRRGIQHGESYCYFREGDRFLLVASLDESFGYTLFTYIDGEDALYIKRDCEDLEVEGDFEAFSLFIAEGSEDEVFDAWFREMDVHPITTVPIAGYSSWYNRYQNIDEGSIADDLAGCSRVMKPGDLFQIDDGWEPFVGDWLECDGRKFPHGMKAAADAIHEMGYSAGLWLAPFVAQQGSKLVSEHPDWLLKVEGEPWSCGSNWGGFYSLDIDNPEVVEYVERVFKRVFDEWGFDLVKLDFLYGAAPFGNSKETRAGRMIRAMKLLRRVCGAHPILGCGVPVMPAFGLVEYCRISCDVSLDWNDKPWMRIIHRERVSTKHAIGNSVFRRELNGRAYVSDPDVFFLRESNIKLSKARKLLLARVNALFGGVFLTSDNMGEYDGNTLREYKRLLALRKAKVTKVETFGNRIDVTYELDGKKRLLTVK